MIQDLPLPPPLLSVTYLPFCLLYSSEQNTPAWDAESGFWGQPWTLCFLEAQSLRL